MAQEGFVTVKDTETGGVFEVTPDAYEGVYGARDAGRYVILTPEEEAAEVVPAAGEGAVDLGSLKVDELRELARARGIPGADNIKRKADLLTALGYETTEEA